MKRYVLVVALWVGCGTLLLAQKVTLGALREINPLMIGVNANMTSCPDPQNNPKLIQAIKTLGVKTIRYPGGTIGNYWDWDTGWIDTSIPDSVMIRWVVTQGIREQETRYTIEKFASLVQQTQTSPVFMLNMLSKDLGHSIRNLKKAEALGLDIKYIELGNELYFDLPLPRTVYPTPEEYGQTCQRWIEALKKEFPDARFAVVGTTMRRHDRQKDWTNRVLAHCPLADAVTFHKYSPSSLDGRQERVRISAGSEGLADHTTASRTRPDSFATHQDWERVLLQDAKAQANMWITTRNNVLTYQKMKLKKDLPLWATEFNMRDDHSLVLDSWAQALILSIYYFEFLEAGVEITNVHNLIGDLFGQIYTRDVRKKPGVGSLYELTAGGIATALFAEATTDMTAGAPLQFSSNMLLENDRGETIEGVRGWYFENEKGEKKMVLVNFGNEPFKCSFREFSGKKKVEIYSDDLAHHPAGFSSLKNISTTCRRTLEMPPFSVAMVHWGNKEL
ncbi:hypothetical protein [Algivirga pacifica]|uniref:Alpha-L-arabinofuranosidase n=1 Tax=Algivirga pacifica TaxID=1162670 RepID=A0ABP9DB55_9BACT